MDEHIPELGNMIFGHSRGEVPLDRDVGWEDELFRLFEAYAPDRDCGWRECGVNFKNEVFEVHPYCWCDDEDCPQCGHATQPNFRHKPSGLEIQWYKYPLRNSYANRTVTLAEFRAIIDGCVNSITA